MGSRRSFGACVTMGILAFGICSSVSAQTPAAAGWQDTPASTLKASLRAVAAAELRFFQEHRMYASSVESLGVRPAPDVQLRIIAAGPGGWQAGAVHRQQPGKSCVIFVGTVDGVESPRTDADREMAGEEGVPLCDWMR